MHAGYWRGTLVFDVVIMGHPLVEVLYKCVLSYPCNGDTAPLGAGFSETGVLEGIGKGVIRLRIPMPFNYSRDLIPCASTAVTLDSLGDFLFPSKVSVYCKIMSTMLDKVPVIPIAIYMSALEDFQFYWPIPPGLYNLGDPTPPPGKKKKRDLLVAPRTLQVGIGAEPVVFETRAQIQTPLPEAHPILYVEDFFRYWCRALPYSSISSNDEPVPRADLASHPCFGFHDTCAITPDVNCSWYCTQDYLSLFSNQFLYYKGSIGLKVICIPTSETDIPYKYIALSYAPVLRDRTHNPFTSSPLITPPESNFGVGALITPADKQPVLEFTVPFINECQWAPSYPLLDNALIGSNPVTSQSLILTTPHLSTNVSLFDGTDLRDALFRKAGADYSLTVETLLPPPTLWRLRGGDWS